MGLLRLILALNVVIGHCSGLFGYWGFGGIIAVESFFIISGFYMALILSEKYNSKADSYKLFISNRLLRLFPTYIFVLLLTLIFSFITLKIFNNGFTLDFIVANIPKLNPFSQFFVFFSMFFMIGQDALLFNTVNPDGFLTFSPNFNADKIQMYRFLPIPQAWTLSLEMFFYIMAPFLIKFKKHTLAAIIILSLLARFITYGAGYNFDPWSYRFFPFEIVFFLFGIFSYFIYRKLKNIELDKKIQSVIFGVLLLCTILFQYIPMVLWLKQWLFYILIIISIPLLFNATKNHKLDRYIGELSYPVYVSHILVINLVTLDIFKIGQSLLCPITIVCAILFSIFLIEFIIKPIENYRQKRVQNTLGVKYES